MLTIEEKVGNKILKKMMDFKHYHRIYIKRGEEQGEITEFLHRGKGDKQFRRVLKVLGSPPLQEESTSMSPLRALKYLECMGVKVLSDRQRDQIWRHTNKTDILSEGE